jgi:hypothetical protein
MIHGIRLKLVGDITYRKNGRLHDEEVLMKDRWQRSIINFFGQSLCHKKNKIPR